MDAEYTPVGRYLRQAGAQEFFAWLSETPERVQQLSPVAAMFKARILKIDHGERMVRAEISGGPAVKNPWGMVHGGFVSAAIDELSSVCAMLFTGPRYFGGTLSNVVQYLSPLRAERIEISARLRRASLTLATVEADVVGDEDLAATGLVLFSLRRFQPPQGEPR